MFHKIPLQKLQQKKFYCRFSKDFELRRSPTKRSSPSLSPRRRSPPSSRRRSRSRSPPPRSRSPSRRSRSPPSTRSVRRVPPPPPEQHHGSSGRNAASAPNHFATPDFGLWDAARKRRSGGGSSFGPLFRNGAENKIGINCHK